MTIRKGLKVLSKVLLLACVLIYMLFLVGHYVLKAQTNKQAEMDNEVAQGIAATQRDDTAEALKWYLKAADQGDATAEIALGALYNNGQGVPNDYTEAARWYRKAADQGEAHAQYYLGLSYSKGQGVPQDYVQAYMWLNLASATFEMAGRSTAMRYKTPENEEFGREVRRARDSVEALMTPAQIKGAQQLTSSWKPK